MELDTCVYLMIIMIMVGMVSNDDDGGCDDDSHKRGRTMHMWSEHMLALPLAAIVLLREGCQ